MGFNIGDRVRSSNTLMWHYGKIGTVVHRAAHGGWVGVRFDDVDPRFHTLVGTCKHGHGYWVLPGCLEHIEDDDDIDTSSDEDLDTLLG